MPKPKHSKSSANIRPSSRKAERGNKESIRRKSKSSAQLIRKKSNDVHRKRSMQNLHRKNSKKSVSGNSLANTSSRRATSRKSVTAAGSKRVVPQGNQPARRATKLIDSQGKRNRPKTKEIATGKKQSLSNTQRKSHKRVTSTDARRRQSSKVSSVQELKQRYDDASENSRERNTRKPSHVTKIRRRFMPKFKEDIELDGPAKAAAELLDLTQKHLHQLKEIFNDIDTDHSGKIGYDEFFKYIEEPRSPFSDALFALIDLDGNGTIDFNEFVQVLTTYCMYGKDDILRFAFDTFDADASGTLDEQEFYEMCVNINNNNPTFAGNFKKAITEFDRNEDGLIDFMEFQEINRKYPLIIFPAFRMQDRMQKSTLGESGWNRIAKRKARDEYIENYMKAHNGALPPESLCTKINNFIFREKKKKYQL